MWLVISWALFYAAVFLGQVTHYTDQRYGAIEDLANNLQGGFLFICYWILTARTLGRNSGDTKLQGGSDASLWFVYSLWLWAVVLYFLIDTFFSLHQRTVFQLCSGLFVGATMGLLTGCLEKQQLGQPRIITALLYLYAVLQLAYVGFEKINDASDLGYLQEFATVTSLPLKLLFIGFWYWIFQNGQLAFYVQRARWDIDTIDDQWRKFRETAGRKMDFLPS